jgi:hypothetical protein
MFRLWLIVIDSRNSTASPEVSRIRKETRFQRGSLWNIQERCAMPASKFYLRCKRSQDIPFQDQAVQEQNSALCTTTIIIIRILHSVNCQASHLSSSVVLFLTKLINNRKIFYFPCTYLSLLSPINSLKANFMVRMFDNLATHIKF